MEFKSKQFFSIAITPLLEEMHYTPLETGYVHLSSDIQWFMAFVQISSDIFIGIL